MDRRQSVGGLAAGLEASLLLGSPLGPGKPPQARLGDRLAALDRQAVSAFGKTLFGSFHGGELVLQRRGERLVDLLLNELGGGVAVVEGVGFFVALGFAQLGERGFDAGALAREQIACLGVIHAAEYARERVRVQ